MSTTYNAGMLPSAPADVRGLAEYFNQKLLPALREEFLNVKRGAEDGKTHETLVALHAEPASMVAGMVVFADGTDWNPGYGAGLYLRNEANTAWDFVSSNLVSGTAQATTSGTSKDFTGIPAWAKRITFPFSGLSTNGTSIVLLQIGEASSGIATSGYLGGNVGSLNGGANTGANSTAGFVLVGSVIAASIVHGIARLELLDASTNTWSFSVSGAYSSAAASFSGGGSKSLSATLDRIRLTTAGGVDTFDAGSANITYE